jgi:hypothetical protein
MTTVLVTGDSRVVRESQTQALKSSAGILAETIVADQENAAESHGFLVPVLDFD